MTPVYLDCNATAPMDPRVTDQIVRFMAEEYGNAGSRTHEYGNRAKQAVQLARDQVAAVVGAQREEVIFTGGATESNNIAILGLIPYAERSHRRHIISSSVEHKAVLEPLEYLASRGFDVTLVPPNPGGWIDPEAISEALRPDTLLISLMQVNNETGVEQPIPEICDRLRHSEPYLHIDAAQGFGKSLAPLRDPRIDLVSISAHKIYGPKGVGALIARRRGIERVPLSPLTFGGGQERGLRPGTVPVPLVVGLGLAAELSVKENEERRHRCVQFRQLAVAGLASLEPEFNGDQGCVLPHVLNFQLPGLDAEAFMLATKDLIAVSNGSACTSHSYKPSHVLAAMGLSPSQIQSSVRLSWCHMTPSADWNAVVTAVRRVR